MSTNAIESQIQQIVSDVLLADEKRLQKEDNLVELHGMDSVSFVELIVALENQFGFKIEDCDMIEENFMDIIHISILLRDKYLLL